MNTEPMEQERSVRGKATATGRLIALNVLITVLFVTPVMAPALLALIGLELARSGQRLPLASGIARRIYERDLRAIAQVNPTCFGPDPELLYAPRPGSRCPFDNLEFRTHLKFNALGARGQERDLIRPEVVVIGDSHAMGWGVEEAESFAGRLRATGIPTLTLAVSSYGTARELLFLERYARQRPSDWASTRMVVLTYAENDQEENAAFPRRYQPTAGSALDYSHALDRARRLGWGPRPIDAALLLQPPFLKAALSATPDTVRAEASRALGTVLPFLARHTRTKLDTESRTAAADLLRVLASYRQLLSGKRLVVVVSTSSGFKNASLATAIGNALATQGPALGVPTVPVLDPLTACVRDCYFVVDDHPNREGHRRIAAALLPLIRPGAGPPGEWKASAPYRRAEPSGADQPPPSPPPPPAEDRQDR